MQSGTVDLSSDFRSPTRKEHRATVTHDLTTRNKECMTKISDFVERLEHYNTIHKHIMHTREILMHKLHPN